MDKILEQNDGILFLPKWHFISIPFGERIVIKFQNKRNVNTDLSHFET